MSHVNALSVFVFLQRSDFTVQLHQIWDSESCPVPAPFWTRRHETCRFNSCITRAPNRKVSCIIETCRDCLWTFYIIYIYICTLYIHILCNCLWRSAKSQLNSKGYPSWNPDHPSMGYKQFVVLDDMTSCLTWQALQRYQVRPSECWSHSGLQVRNVSESELGAWKRLLFSTKKTLEKSKENENDTPTIRDSRLGAEGQLDEGRLRRSCDLSMRRDQSSKIRNNSAQVQIQSRHFARRLFTFHSCDLGNKGDSNGSMTTSRVQEIHQHTTSTGPWGKCPWPFGTAAMAPHDTPTWHSDMVPQLGRTWHRDMAPNHNSQA